MSPHTQTWGRHNDAARIAPEPLIHCLANFTKRVTPDPENNCPVFFSTSSSPCLSISVSNPFYTILTKIVTFEEIHAPKSAIYRLSARIAALEEAEYRDYEECRRETAADSRARPFGQPRNLRIIAILCERESLKVTTVIPRRDAGLPHIPRENGAMGTKFSQLPGLKVSIIATASRNESGHDQALL
ncbi:hypothetical protein BS47DRAFT_1389202 [Hydnum rufescens UP504]|uniref:Uncharacterized protein n=1 Tax=Hydnum rufescens UP504 TaxID=1448309 RepID=A0A9P6B696_9AGAM|nr:hypothetical protein BS47DRAFT_1389202 [Hydnum rufescens UP504]